MKIQLMYVENICQISKWTVCMGKICQISKWKVCVWENLTLYWQSDRWLIGLLPKKLRMRQKDIEQKEILRKNIEQKKYWEKILSKKILRTNIEQKNTEKKYWAKNTEKNILRNQPVLIQQFPDIRWDETFLKKLNRMFL